MDRTVLASVLAMAASRARANSRHFVTPDDFLRCAAVEAARESDAAANCVSDLLEHLGETSDVPQSAGDDLPALSTLGSILRAGERSVHLPIDSYRGLLICFLRGAVGRSDRTECGIEDSTMSRAAQRLEALRGGGAAAK